MRRARRFVLLLVGFSLAACAAGSMQFRAEGGPYPRRATVDQIQVFEAEPGRAYDRVGQITWDYTHSKFAAPELAEILPALKQKAWESGGDALIIRRASFTGQPAPNGPLHVVADVIRWRP